MSIKCRNGYIAEGNSIISFFLSCNTNAELLGTEKQVKSILIYLLNYMAKDPT